MGPRIHKHHCCWQSVKPVISGDQTDWLLQTQLYDPPDVHVPSALPSYLPRLHHFVVQGVSTDPEKLGPKAAVVNGKNVLQLLNHCSGSFRPGILTALVGSSGAGKTTLMDVLAGRKTSEAFPHSPNSTTCRFFHPAPPHLITSLNICMLCSYLMLMPAHLAHAVFPAGCGTIHWPLYPPF